jgi:hypothetical protein
MAACRSSSKIIGKMSLILVFNKNFSSHKLPKQQLTNFWSQGILGINMQLFFLVEKIKYELGNISHALLGIEMY